MKLMAPAFTAVKEDQLQLLSQISKSTFKAAFEVQNNPVDFNSYIKQAFNPDKLRLEWTNDNTTFYFCKLGSDVIGYFKINTGRAQSEFKDIEGLELERIYILSAYQNQGLGKRILDYVCELARLQDKTYVWLGVWQENPRAVKLYETYGFKKIGTHPYYIGTDKQTDWLLRKDI